MGRRKPSHDSEPAGQSDLPFDATRDGRPARITFLGWERHPLAVAADRILAELGHDLADCLVALPGSGAARSLRRALARRAPPLWVPPRVLTQGELTDELVELERPVADRSTRTLAWQRAIERLSAAQRARLQRPGRMDERERLRLAETVRALHAELAAEGKSFAELASGPGSPGLVEERERWEALAHAQAAYRQELGDLGLEDPHEGRLRAIDEGRVRRDRRVVLVGVADMNHLLVRLLRAIPAQVSVLVAAPPELAAGFDELGRLISAFWRDREIPLSLAAWHVADRPADLADATLSILAGWKGRFAADELALGIADEEVVPYLERRLRRAGARARHVAGTPLERTRPVQLLRALARTLARGGFMELAALVRHPDLAPAVHHGGGLVQAFDDYHREHLPRNGRGSWVEDARCTAIVRGFQERLERELGALGSGERRALCDWADPIRTFLLAMYPRRLDTRAENERVLALALRAIGQGLSELEGVPRALSGPELSAAEALEHLGRSLAGERIPPTEAEDEPAVALLGWLDLPLDDAAAAIVTGFNEGRIPRSLVSDAFLPDGLRRRLGLPGDEDRLARDVYAATLLLETKAAIAFVSLRRTTDGDPLVPSRLAFHRPESEIAARVKRFLPEETDHRPVLQFEPGADFRRPRTELWTVPETLRVSAFKSYLDSPYRFFLEHVLQLKTLDDRARELDPLHFGSLAHCLLEKLGAPEIAGCADAKRITEFLRAELAREAALRFGDDPLPAVLLQIEQLGHRLGIFAEKEAERRRAGWRIHAVEWTPPPEAAFLEVDGIEIGLSGRIDRIDVHDDGRWAILDYKAGEAPRAPKKAHRARDGSWIDLQLPLYAYLARGLFPGRAELGYGRFGKDATEIDFWTDVWGEAELDEALEEARGVVRCIRNGEFYGPSQREPYEEIFRALLGEGMTVSSESEGEA